MGQYSAKGKLDIFALPMSERVKIDEDDYFGTYAPLYQQAFSWFEENYGLWFRPDYYDETRG